MLKHFVDDQRLTMRLYAIGAFLFFIGLGIILWTDRLLEPSFQQEIYALVGSAIGGLGFITAMAAQTLLIIHRFKYMGSRKH